MAVYTIVADLNGGDAVTANSDLIFKIYDGSDDSLIDTTGSHTTDSDVTVSGDSVTITNVTSTATSFKISAVDETANESVLSDAYDTSTIIVSDDFTGTTIDTGKWTVVNTNPTKCEFTQNDELKIDMVALFASSNQDYIHLTSTYTGGVAFSLDLRVESPDVASKFWQGGFQDLLSGLQNRVTFERGTAAGDIKISRQVAGGSIDTQDVTLDVSTTKTLKFTDTGGFIRAYYWGGSSWTELGTAVAGTFDADMLFKHRMHSSAGLGATYIDNLYISNADFSTQYPV